MTYFNLKNSIAVASIVIVGTLASSIAMAQEVRIGAFQNIEGPERGNRSISLEAISPPIYSNDRSTGAWPLDLKLIGGATVNAYGGTSFLKAGIIAQLPTTGPVFAEVGLGGAINNGNTSIDSKPGCAAMGCRASFWLEAGLCARITDRWTALLTIEHTSNGRMCERNQGLTLAGIKLAYRF